MHGESPSASFVRAGKAVEVSMLHRCEELDPLRRGQVQDPIVGIPHVAQVHASWMWAGDNLYGHELVLSASSLAARPANV